SFPARIVAIPASKRYHVELQRSQLRWCRGKTDRAVNQKSALEGKLRMKRIILASLAGLALALLSSAQVHATVTLPYYEGFAYTEGNLNAQGGPNWFVGNGSTTFEIAVSNSAALAAPAGMPAATGKGIRRAPSGTSRRCVLQYTSVPAVDG